MLPEMNKDASKEKKQYTCGGRYHNMLDSVKIF